MVVVLVMGVGGTNVVVVGVAAAVNVAVGNNKPGEFEL